MCELSFGIIFPDIMAKTWIFVEYSFLHCWQIFQAGADYAVLVSSWRKKGIVVMTFFVSPVDSFVQLNVSMPLFMPTLAGFLNRAETSPFGL